MAWLDELQDASWRGVPFVVVDSEVRRGRRVAVHDYPYRDVVWVEDLGRNRRQYEFRGFTVGEDCYDIEQQMLDAAEIAGPGVLVHPSLGSLQVSLIDFSAGQRREMGRVVEFTFRFIEGSPGLDFPGSASATQDDVDDDADDADAASSGDFFDRAGAAISAGAASLRQAADTVQGVVATGLGVVGSAQRLANSVQGLASLAGVNLSLGRYAQGGIALGLGSLGGVLASVNGIASTVGRVEAGANAAIANTLRLGAAVQTAGETVQNLVQSI